MVSEAPTGSLGIGPAVAATGPLPEWLGSLVGAALTASGPPTAILLPATRLVAETCALLCCGRLARTRVVSVPDLVASISAGTRVRVLPDEGVYQFGGPGNEGYWLSLLDVRNTQSAGRIWTPGSEAARFEPTVRRRPLGGPARSGWGRLEPTPWDRFSGTDIRGNAGRSRLCVVFIGNRTDFEAALEGVAFSRIPGEPGVHVGEGLPWARVDEDGGLELLSPTRAAGEPFLAVARDHVSARRLSDRRAPGSLVFVSARPDDALADPTSAERIAERQALLVISPGRYREAFLKMRREGWTVAELSASRVLQARPTGIGAIDRVSQVSSWMARRPSSLAQPCPELEEAFRFLDLFSRATLRHLEEEEEVADIADQLRQAFFEASDWLSAPGGEELEDLAETFASIRRRLPGLRSIAGEAASEAALGLIGSLEIFAGAVLEKTITPKGECVLRLAQAAQTGTGYSQVIVTGHRRTADEVTRFLDAHGAPVPCVTPAGLAGSEVARINVLSILRRDAFVRLVDPWVARDVMFLGYRHEVEIYSRRLKARERTMVELRPDEGLMERVPGFRPGAGEAEAAAPTAPQPPRPQDDDLFGPLPRRRPPTAGHGEASRPARYVRFAGRSWMAVTDDHEVVRVLQGRQGGLQVESVTAADLQPGDLILTREGGGKDVVREMAEQIAGPEAYARLRERAAHWRNRLRSAGVGADVLRTRLAGAGLERGLPTIRKWVSEEVPVIGPQDPDEALPQIAAALGEDPAGRDWRACLSAILALRSHHSAAGHRLTEVLMSECGSAIVEQTGNETPLELSMGTVWLLELETLDLERRPWPVGQLNRLQWESEAWKRRQLRLRREAAGGPRPGGVRGDGEGASREHQ